MAALAFVVEPTAVIVFGPPANLARAVEDADASVMRIGERFVVARSNSAGLAKRLYSGGAWFVWPALPAGCVAKKRDG